MARSTVQKSQLKNKRIQPKGKQIIKSYTTRSMICKSANVFVKNGQKKSTGKVRKTQVKAKSCQITNARPDFARVCKNRVVKKKNKRIVNLVKKIQVKGMHVQIDTTRPDFARACKNIVYKIEQKKRFGKKTQGKANHVQTNTVKNELMKDPIAVKNMQKPEENVIYNTRRSLARSCTNITEKTAEMEMIVKSPDSIKSTTVLKSQNTLKSIVVPVKRTQKAKKMNIYARSKTDRFMKITKNMNQEEDEVQKKKTLTVKPIQKNLKLIKKRPQKHDLLMKLTKFTRSQNAKRAVMQALIKEAQNKPEDTVVRGVSVKADFSVKDINGLLEKGRMLSDTHVKFLLESICRDEAAIVDSLWLSSLNKTQKIMEKIMTSKLVILPINHQGHWSVILLNHETRFAVHCDSITLESKESYHEAGATRVVNAIAANLGVKLEFYKVKVEQQVDNYSCGLHVLRNTELLIKGGRYEDENVAIDSFRPRYVERLLFGGLDENLVPKLEFIEPVKADENDDDDIEILEEEPTTKNTDMEEDSTLEVVSVLEPVIRIKPEVYEINDENNDVSIVQEVRNEGGKVIVVIDDDV